MGNEDDGRIADGTGIDIDRETYERLRAQGTSERIARARAKAAAVLLAKQEVAELDVNGDQEWPEDLTPEQEAERREKIRAAQESIAEARARLDEIRTRYDRGRYGARRPSRLSTGGELRLLLALAVALVIIGMIVAR